MPLIKGAASDFTTWGKYNALQVKNPTVASRTAVALPATSIISTATVAARVAITVSPKTAVVTVVNNSKSKSTNK